MFVFDTDILTHFLRGDERVVRRRAEVTEDVVITVVTRIEVLQGRFASLLKAADAAQARQAQNRLAESERQLSAFEALPVGEPAAAEFERLLGVKGLKKIGRGDLLIAAVVLASGATLVTRNRKDFGKVPRLKTENWVD